jgi:hypothetical protein
MRVVKDLFDVARPPDQTGTASLAVPRRDLLSRSRDAHRTRAHNNAQTTDQHAHSGTYACEHVGPGSWTAALQPL